MTNLLPDSNWLRFLDVKGSVATATSAASAAILILAELELLHLEQVPGWGLAIVGMVCLLSGTLAVARLFDLLASQRKLRLAAQAEKQEAALRVKALDQMKSQEAIAILRHLDTLSMREREILSWLVQSNQRSFHANKFDGYQTMLEAKGLIDAAVGVFDIQDWPFIVPEFVWNELQRRKDEFQTANIDEGLYPWVRREF